MISLNATTRAELGKRSKKLRRAGILPGVLYGPKVKNTPISLAYKDFESVYKEAGESALVSVTVDGKENIVLIRDAVSHPLSRKFLHADFYQVPMDEEITITVPFIFENDAPAVKDEGAVLVRNVYEISVSALPKNLPREIIIDLSSLEHTGDAIVAKDLSVPEGVQIDAEDDLVIVSVAAPQEEIIEEEVGEEEISPEDIKTEAEERREEKDEEETASEEAAEESQEG